MKSQKENSLSKEEDLVEKLKIYASRNIQLILILTSVFLILISVLMKMMFQNDSSLSMIPEISMNISLAIIPAALITFLYQKIYDEILDKRIERVTKDINDDIKQEIIKLEESLSYVNNDKMTLKIDEVIKKVDNISKNESCVLCKNNIINIYKNRNSANIFDVLKRAKKTIRIYVTNLEKMVVFQKSLVELLYKNKNLNIKIMALNPENQFVLNRFSDLNNFNKQADANEVNDLYYGMVSSLSKFITLKSCIQEDNIRDRIRIKMFDSPPTFMMFGSDDEAIVCFIFHNIYGSDGMHIHFNTSEDHLTNNFIKSFDDLWEDIEKDITKEDIVNMKAPVV